MSGMEVDKISSTLFLRSDLPPPFQRKDPIDEMVPESGVVKMPFVFHG
jgi:hypothetical protein